MRGFLSVALVCALMAVLSALSMPAAYAGSSSDDSSPITAKMLVAGKWVWVNDYTFESGAKIAVDDGVDSLGDHVSKSALQVLDGGCLQKNADGTYTMGKAPDKWSQPVFSITAKWQDYYTCQIMSGAFTRSITIVAKKLTVTVNGVVTPGGTRTFWVCTKNTSGQTVDNCAVSSSLNYNYDQRTMSTETGMLATASCDGSVSRGAKWIGNSSSNYNLEFIPGSLKAPNQAGQWVAIPGTPTEARGISLGSLAAGQEKWISFQMGQHLEQIKVRTMDYNADELPRNSAGKYTFQEYNGVSLTAYSYANQDGFNKMEVAFVSADGARETSTIDGVSYTFAPKVGTYSFRTVREGRKGPYSYLVVTKGPERVALAYSYGGTVYARQDGKYAVSVSQFTDLVASANVTGAGYSIVWEITDPSGTVIACIDPADVIDGNTLNFHPTTVGTMKFTIIKGGVAVGVPTYLVVTDGSGGIG